MLHYNYLFGNKRNDAKILQCTLNRRSQRTVEKENGQDIIVYPTNIVVLGQHNRWHKCSGIHFFRGGYRSFPILEYIVFDLFLKKIGSASTNDKVMNFKRPAWNPRRDINWDAPSLLAKKMKYIENFSAILSHQSLLSSTYQNVPSCCIPSTLYMLIQIVGIPVRLISLI